jgi:methyl-accepting chemotaxis protein
MKRKDEVGRITASFHQMQKQIFDMLTSIKTESVNLENSTNILIQSTDEVYKDIENISATTEELSAGSEETAASTEEMSSTAIEIEREIESVTVKTNHGAIVASEIKARAEQLEAAALESKKTAIDVYDITNKQLRDSIDKTGAIEEIKSLSQTILSISAQTHLLALNASIESARAGEAGKGFAVVANEIKNLARNSKEAVSKIDQIINDVAKAVEAMVIDSKNLLEFVDTKVVKDYEVLVQTSEQYHDDADTIENMVSTIKSSTTQLYESIQYIRKAIEEVTTATSESSRGATDIAEKSSSIALKSNQVLEQTQKNKEIIDHLNGMIQFFKI